MQKLPKICLLEPKEIKGNLFPFFRLLVIGPSWVFKKEKQTETTFLSKSHRLWILPCEKNLTTRFQCRYCDCKLLNSDHLPTNENSLQCREA